MKAESGRFASWVTEYVEYRRQLGYQTKSTNRNLRSLANFMDREAAGHSLTDAWILRWRETQGHRSTFRLESLAAFVPWLALRDPEARVSKSWLHQRRRPRPAPYLYEPEEVIALMRAAEREPERGQGFRRHTYSVVIGLLATTGLRIGEALKLDRNDVDLRGAALRIRESKGVSVRMVPLHPSTADALRRYAELRERHHPIARSDAFFSGSFGGRLRYKTFNRVFQSLRKNAGVPFRSHPRAPRIHDLRHTFATRHLLRAHREGGDMHCAVADLSVYLGHCHVEDTYWYLTGIPELMACCGERFLNHVEGRRQEGRP